MRNDVLIQHEGYWLRFRDPVRVVTVGSPAEVLPALHEIETAVNEQGLTAAGFITYEAAAAFDLAVHDPIPGLPLLWFGLYASHEEIGDWPIAAPYTVGDWQPAISRAEYETAVRRIKDYIARGHTYQVNYTFPLQTDFAGEPLALFADLAAAQQGAYAAFVDAGRFALASASPELFFRLDGERLLSKPMKGTADRGRTLAEDEANIDWLRQSEKNRAENVMIVDMIRNDVGRVAQVGSVAVPRLFDVERYPTVLQMTSTVTARTHASLVEILAHMFPCASITGAPKVRTMELIRELEPHPRGVYTGAVGFMAPGRQAQFNVAIRTVLVDRARQRAIYGVGSGIVWDSDPTAEYEECRVKARVLTTRRPSFALLETMRWRPDEGIFLRAEHMRRLADSAVYFGVPLDRTAVEAALDRQTASLTEPSKLRLLLAQDGTFRLEITPIDLPETQPNQPVRVGLAPAPVDSGKIWLYHKTTQRQMYTAACAARPDCDDVILWNERGELTESTIANLVLALDGELVTPPVTSGLLAGTMRTCLLRHGRIRERVLTKTDLTRAQTIYLINSVRGWQTAVLVP